MILDNVDVLYLEDGHVHVYKSVLEYKQIQNRN